MSESTLKKSKNYYRIVGTLSELDLTREECDIKLKDENGNDDGTTKGERIRGKIAVEIPSGVVTADVYFQNLTQKPNKDGSHENKMWSMAESMMDWNPKIGGSGGEPTVVDIQGSVAINDYPNQQGKISSSLRWNVSKASSKGKTDEAGASLSAVGYIRSIKPELRGEEETGRLLVSLYGADGQGKCFPIDAIVAEDMADDFTEAFEVGQTLNADFDLVSITVGKKSTGKKAFGREASINTSTGFSKSELMLVGADVVEEPDEKTYEDENGKEIEVKTDWINPVAMKKAIKARQEMLDELLANGGTTKKPAPKKSNSFAAKKKAVEDTEFDSDDELPF